VIIFVTYQIKDKMENRRNNKREFNKGENRRSAKPFKRKTEGFKSNDDRKDKPDGYKAKRSFTKNKNFRAKKDQAFSEKPTSSFSDKKQHKRPFERSYSDKPKPGINRENKRIESEEPKRSFNNKLRDTGREGSSGFKRDGKRSEGDRPKRRFEEGGQDRENKGSFEGRNFDRDKRYSHRDFEEGKSYSGKKPGGRFEKPKAKPQPKKPAENSDGLIRLNKYLSNAGIASRREADTLIQGGTVKVNGVVIDQLGYKIKPGDKVTYGDSSVKSERKVYLLLNKPKDYITTMDDPQERKTVMELIKGACKERVYPVGRLDRNTTGLLLFTNDGELTKKLTHPKFGIKKVYHVSLNKGLRADDFKQLIEGVELEDGFIKVDDLAFVGEGKKEIGVEIHSGRNRIVRRLFEHLGYDVLKLDRVVFAGLTKKDLPRAKHRFLNAKEISFLQMLG